MLDDAIIYSLAEACDNPRARVLVLLSAHCWLKRNQLLELTYEQVLNQNDIVGPGGIPLTWPANVIDAVRKLKEHNPDDILIFQSSRSKDPRPVSATYLSRYIEAASEQLGLETIRLEMLRRYWAKRYVEAVDSQFYLDRLKELMPYYQRNSAASLADYLGVDYQGRRGRPKHS